ncbi:MAG TPA: cytochrome c oxidase assembly protein [Kouleothrix sp.]|jgi:putative membrane protein|nr:cytochrome c oxidase assembly protein [Kouleothrix sp.]
MFAWNWDISVLLGLAVQVGAYLLCIGPLRSRFPGSEPVSPAQVQTFLLGSLVLFIALCSPIETLGDGYLLSAHMIQHLLITLIAPPLLLLGTPRWLFRPLLRLPFALPIGRFITNPIFAFLSFNLVFAIWHTPAYYEATLRSLPIHILEHVLFFTTATLTWWPVFSPMDELPRLPDPAQCLYLFLESLPPTILGALITFAGWILYPTYARAPRVWGLSAALDQQIAGLTMWIPGALVFLSVLTVVFFRWFNADEYSPSQDARSVVQ